MAEDFSYKDVPPRVMELLRMFLAANSRGEVAVLCLETRKKTLTTNYKNEVRTEITGTPANTTDVTKKKQNPSRARRSLLRLKKFMQMKENAKLEQSEVNSEPQAPRGLDAGQVPDEESHNTSQLVLNLAREGVTPVETGPSSPIPQVDGEGEKVRDGDVVFTFDSEYGEEDVTYTLEQVFQGVQVTLRSRTRVQPMKANHLCVVAIKVVPEEKETFAWPKMKAYDAEVFSNLKRIQ